MLQGTRTAWIYGLAGLVGSLTLASWARGPQWPELLFYWLIAFALPLLFAFSYPRHFWGPFAGDSQRKYALVLNAVCLTVVAFLFPKLHTTSYASRHIDEMTGAIIGLTSLPFLLIATLFLLIKKRSSAAIVAPVFLWSFWFVVAETIATRFSLPNTPRTASCFAYFLAPMLFAFATGTATYRVRYAHWMAILGGICSLPLTFLIEFWDFGLVNTWIRFNARGRRAWYEAPDPKLIILGVTLVIAAVIIAILRLLPSQWKIRKTPVSERTWPAFAVSLVVLVIWFTKSVTPYRIPDAPYSSYEPILRILHIEKHGLQFHETCFSVYSGGKLFATHNDRRLARYRFDDEYGSAQLPEPLMARVNALIASRSGEKDKSKYVEPTRAWDADNWYYRTRAGIQSFTAENREQPPADVVALFHELETFPRTAGGWVERDDVCLGFCYDPLAELGISYSYQRLR